MRTRRRQHNASRSGLTVSERDGWVRLSPHATTDPSVVEVLEGLL